MRYDLHGTFIESCDCFSICPCWVEEEADENHCTGLVAWSLGDGSLLDGLPVGGRRVVCATVHGSTRRGAGAQTAVFVDDGASPEQEALLARAFTGGFGGPLAGLASVSGAVVLAGRADIVVTEELDTWRIVVSAPGGTPGGYVDAAGGPKLFDSSPRPMTLRDTAMSQEYGAEDRPVTAHTATTLRVAVGALPGGYLDVTGRSGMSGTFRYLLASEAASDDADSEVAPTGPPPHDD